MSANSDKENKELFGFSIAKQEPKCPEEIRFIRLQNDDYYYAFDKNSKIYVNKNVCYLTKYLNNFIDDIKNNKFDRTKLNNCYNSIEKWCSIQYPQGGQEKASVIRGFKRKFTLHIANVLVNKYCNANEIYHQCLEKSDTTKYKILKTNGFFNKIKIGKKHIFSKTATLRGEINEIYNELNHATDSFEKLLEEFQSRCQELKKYRERRNKTNKNYNPDSTLSTVSTASKSSSIKY